MAEKREYISVRELSVIFKKAGIPRSKTNMSSRVHGWPMSTSEGWYTVNELYPWRTRYTRNGYYVWGYIHDRQQELDLTYQPSRHAFANHEVREVKNMMEKMEAALTQANVSYTITKNGYIQVKINNPFSESDIKRAEVRWDEVTRNRRRK